MTTIQIILLLGICAIGLYYLLRMRKKVFDILFAGALVAIGVLFILQPELSNKISQKVGVGRGADLVFYISILLFWFIILRLVDRIRRLEQLFTDLVRKESLNEARSSKPPQN